MSRNFAAWGARRLTSCPNNQIEGEFDEKSH
jgi:hypothetical protein